MVLILFFSANNGNVDVIECLLNAGAKIDARTEWGDLPIHYAACWGTHQVLEYLFEEGSPVDKPAAGKQSPSDKVIWWILFFYETYQVFH